MKSMLSLLQNLNKPVCFLFVFMLGVMNVAFAEHTIYVLNLPHISEWEQKVFSAKTRYDVVSIDGKPYLKATSKSSASGLIRHIDIDLTKTPYLKWTWKVDNILKDIDETQKSGDDYVARVYVVISGGLFFWNTRAISYNWTSSEPEGSTWPNAYTDNAIMVSVQSGAEQAGEWVSEKRNVLEDVKNLLGIEATEINAVAIMTDTDNSKQSATAYYGNIMFSEE